MVLVSLSVSPASAIPSYELHLGTHWNLGGVNGGGGGAVSSDDETHSYRRSQIGVGNSPFASAGAQVHYELKNAGNKTDKFSKSIRESPSTGRLLVD